MDAWRSAVSKAEFEKVCVYYCIADVVRCLGQLSLVEAYTIFAAVLMSYLVMP